MIDILEISPRDNLKILGLKCLDTEIRFWTFWNWYRAKGDPIEIPILKKNLEFKADFTP